MKKWRRVGITNIVISMLMVTITGCAFRGEEDLKHSQNLMKQLNEDQNLMKQLNEEQKMDSNSAAKQQGAAVSESFRQDISDFALNLWREEYKNNKSTNVMVSPLSIAEALGMTENGAANETLEQMKNVMGTRETQEEFNHNLRLWADGMENSQEAKLNVANAIWFSCDKIKVSQDFLRMNQEYYHAGIYQSVFDQKTVDDINGWVKNETNDMIPEIIQQLDSSTIMVLVNAIAFDAKWEAEYSEGDVWEQDFTMESEEVQQLEFMHSTEDTYLEGKNVTGFMKPYKEGYSFVALLPEEGVTVQEYAKSLTGEEFLTLLEQKQTGETVYASIPKFKSDYSCSLNKTLMELGIKDAFDGEGADFSRLVEDSYGNIYISDVLHKTYIEVDESGTKAAAATAVLMQETAAVVEDDKEVYLDRPFLYAIVDDETKLPIFIGTYQGEK